MKKIYESLLIFTLILIVYPFISKLSNKLNVSNFFKEIIIDVTIVIIILIIIIYLDILIKKLYDKKYIRIKTRIYNNIKAFNSKSIFRNISKLLYLNKRTYFLRPLNLPENNIFDLVLGLIKIIIKIIVVFIIYELLINTDLINVFDNIDMKLNIGVSLIFITVIGESLQIFITVIGESLQIFLNVKERISNRSQDRREDKQRKENNEVEIFEENKISEEKIQKFLSIFNRDKVHIKNNIISIIENDDLQKLKIKDIKEIKSNIDDLIRVGNYFSDLKIKTKENIDSKMLEEHYEGMLDNTVLNYIERRKTSKYYRLKQSYSKLTKNYDKKQREINYIRLLFNPSDELEQIISAKSGDKYILTYKEIFELIILFESIELFNKQFMKIYRV